MVRILVLLLAVVPAAAFAEEPAVTDNAQDRNALSRKWVLSVGFGTGGLTAMPLGLGTGLFYPGGTTLGVTLERRMTTSVSLFATGGVLYSSHTSGGILGSSSMFGGSVSVGTRALLVQPRDDIRILADVRTRLGLARSTNGFGGPGNTVDSRSVLASAGLDAEYSFTESFGLRFGTSLVEGGWSGFQASGLANSSMFNISAALSPYAEACLRF